MHCVSLQNFGTLFSKLSLLKRDYGINDKVVFINSNELGIKKTAEILKSIEFPKNGCHIGVSCWHNFDIAVQTKSNFIITFDYNNSSVHLMKKSVVLLETSVSRKEFISNMAKYLSERSPRIDKGSQNSPILRLHFRDEKENERFLTYPEKKGENIVEIDFLHPLNIISYGKVKDVWELALNEEAKRAESWLSSDESYSYMKELAMQKRIVNLCLSICDEKAFDEIGSILKECSVRANTLYLSNIYDYFSSIKRETEQSDSFCCNVEKLIDPETVIIEACCTPSMGFYDGLQQNVVKGKDPVSKNAYSPDHLRGLKSKTETDQELDEKHRKEYYPAALLLSPRS